jgi:hypothetical protein
MVFRKASSEEPRCLAQGSRTEGSAMPTPQKTFSPRSRNRFRERELARAVRAAKAAGGERVEVDLTRNTISVVLGKPGEPNQASSNDLDDWIAKREGKNARQT